MDGEDQKDQEAMKPLTPQELLKERGWEKLVTDRMKSLIDEQIIVLRQDYTEIKNKQQQAAIGGAADGAQGPQGDGTQIRTYINNVMIKVNMSEVIKSNTSKATKGKQEMLE